MIAGAALPRMASANLVQNADFTSVTYSGTMALSGTIYGQFGTNYLTLTDWTTTGYNFVYAPGTADAGTQANGANAGVPQQAPGQYTAPNGYGNTYMWGPNNGSANGLPANSPAGGNFIAMDGAYEVVAVSQTITGLIVGKSYGLVFWWAGAQQQGFTGTTSEAVTASLGGQSFTTGTVAPGAEGFSGWMQQQFVFSATSATETLSFLAIGTPTGQPPFVLLAGVNLELLPECTNWLVLGGFGVVCICWERRRRRRRMAAVQDGQQG